MKKKMRRLVAMLLAVAMVVQQGSTLGVLAMETEPISEGITEAAPISQESETKLEEAETTPAPAPETKAEEPKSETSTEKAVTPETKAEALETAPVPETKVEETQPTAAPTSEPATETKPEETEPASQKDDDAQDTGAAAETATEPSENTESSEPAAESETVTGEEQTIDGQNGQAAEPETELKGETKPEPETEAATETEKLTEAGPTILEASCSNVKITVTAEQGALEAGTILKVKEAPIDPVKAAVANTLKEDEWIGEMLAFDISLELNGQEVQPQGKVQVAFANVPFAADAQNDDSEIFVVHMQEETSGVSTISAFAALPGTASGLEIQEGLKIETTHFSIYAVFKKMYEDLKKESENGTLDSEKESKWNELKDKGYDTLPQIEEDKYQSQKPHLGYDAVFGDETEEDEDRQAIEDALRSPAFDFHIFSDEATINQHTNGNIATNHYTSGGLNFGTNQGKEDGVVEYNYFGESVDAVGTMVEGTKTVLGNDVDVYTANNGSALAIGSNGTNQSDEVSKNVYYENENEKFLNIEKELENLGKLSKKMAKAGTKEGNKNVSYAASGSDQGWINVSGSEKINYLNITADELSRYKWTIYGLENKTLIVNVDMTGADPDVLSNLYAFADGHSNGEGMVRSNCNILWNFYVTDDDGNIETCKDTISVGDQVMGTLLAPDAEVKYGAINGSIIARKTVQNGKESHKMTFTGFSATLNVTKLLLAEGETDKEFYFALFEDAEGTKRVPGQFVKSVKLSDGQAGTVQFAELDPGTYYLFETDKNGTKIENSGYKVTGNGQKIEIKDEGKDVEAQITNSKEDKGSIVVTKLLKYNGIPDSDNKSFKVALFSDAAGTEMVGEAKTVNMDGKSSASVAFRNLDPGTYYVFEVDDNGKPIKDGVSGEYVVTGSGQTVTLSEGEPYKNVTITNDRQEKGKITVTKKVMNGWNTVSVTDTFYVALFKDSAGRTRVGDVKTITLENAGEGSAVFENLEPGTYYVFETDATGKPVGNSSEYMVQDNGQAVTVAKGSTDQKAEIVNRKCAVEFKAKKIYKGGTTFPAEGFTFVLEGLNNAPMPSWSNSVEVTVRNGIPKSFGLISNLESGKTYEYKIYEKAGTRSDIQYDTTVYHVTVEVTGSYGECRANVTVTKEKDGVTTQCTPGENPKEFTAEFINTRTVGDLKVSKTVTGSGDKNKDFNFTVTLSDTSINGKYGDMTFADGVATFTLKHGQSKTATGLPADVTYSVVETEANQDGYTTSSEGAEGTIQAGVTATATFTNGKEKESESETEKPKTGSLTVTKTVTGTAGDKTKDFGFKVELGDNTVNGKYGDMTFANGVATFTLKHGESATASGLPAGISYTVTETNANGYNASATGDTGTIPEDGTATAAFTNNKETETESETEKPKTGSLIVTKTVTGVGDATKEFHFKVELSDKKISGKYGDMTFEDGVAEFTLRHGESKKSENLPEGISYTVIEAEANQNGYITKSTGEAGEIAEAKEAKADFVNSLFSVKVSKVDVVGGKELKGAHIQILDESGKVVEEWDSAEEPHEVKGLKTGETYTLKETVAPDGYTVTASTTFTLKDDGTIDSGKTTTNMKDGVLLVEDDMTSVKVSKVDVANGKELKGAHIQILDESGKVVEEWDSAEEPHEVKGLKTGETYTLKETVAPDGYTVTASTTFTLKDDGTIDSGKTTTNMKDGVLLVEDDMTSVKVSKVDVVDGEELEGAHIQILDKDGNVVEEWDSTKEPHEVKGLKTGETYTLRETVAPNGYDVTTDTTFTLNTDGTVDSGRTTTNSRDGVLLVEDSRNYSLSIRKIDEGGEALVGAKLVLKDVDGNPIDSWTTDGKTHDISKLAKGKYTLSEIEAPKGYQVSADIPVEITGTEPAGKIFEIEMTDKKIPESDNRSLTVTKKLELSGVSSDLMVTEATYYVALFSDEARTQRVSDVKQIVFKDATVSSVTFENLGKTTYYVGETDANGNRMDSMKIGDRLIFYPEYGANAQFEFKGRIETAIAEFTNVYVELPPGFYLSGEITVTKKILLNGAEGTSDETYYAGIFNSPDMSEPLEVVALALNGGSSTSYTVTNLPIGETVDSTATYYVAETDEYGNVLNPDAVTEFEISIDKSEIVLDANNSRQEVVITNSFTEEETETETETETEAETEVPKTEAPKTGDDTDFMRYLLLMMFSAGICAVAFEEKRRKAGRAKK